MRSVRLQQLGRACIASAQIVVWFFTRPRTQGAVCFIIKDGHVLLIRKTYLKSTWSLPGGNCEKNEAPAEAACREVKEEVGIDVSIEQYLGSYVEREFFRHHTTHIYTGYPLADEYQRDPVEISIMQYFPLSDLPDTLGLSVRNALAYYYGNSTRP